MAIKLNSTGGGSVTLDSPSTASNYTVTLPAATSTLIDTTSTQTLTNKTLTAAGSNTVEATSGPTSSQLGGMRNKIINGDMRIDQRNAGASVTPTTINAATYFLDRWNFYNTVASKLSYQQSNSVYPAGFSSSMAVTVAAAYSPTGSDAFSIEQPIEAFNVSDLSFGSASAQSITVSFWVRSSLTGTFSGSIKNNASSRSYPFTYAISSANTWEYKTITIAGDQTGTWISGTNGVGLRLVLDMGCGSNRGTANTWQASNLNGVTGAVQLVANAGATFYITGVQLEKGATATPFENRLYGTELALCMRYYEKSYPVDVAPGTAGISGYCGSTVASNTVPNSFAYSSTYFKVTKRTYPTITIYGYAGGVTNVSNNNNGADLGNNTGTLATYGVNGFQLYNSSGTTPGTGLYGVIWHFVATSEL